MTKEEMEKQIHGFAEMMYRTGYEDAQKDWHSIEKEEREMNYKRGLDDAWECARKIMLCEAKGGFSTDKYTEIFGNIATFQVLEILSASEAIFAIKEYEDKRKKIRPNCSYLNDICPYDIKCVDCEVHCSLKRARNKIKELKGDKE